jgi:hypothetical protein
MTWLLRGTRASLLLGGGVLSAITVAIALEAAFSGRAMRPGVVGAVNGGLLAGLLVCWLTAVVMLAIARAHLLLGAARLARRRAQLADTWTYIAAVYFLIWTVMILLGLRGGPGRHVSPRDLSMDRTRLIVRASVGYYPLTAM